MDEVGLIDIWRIRNPDEFNYTWHKKSPNPICSRLDWLLINSNMQTCVNEADIFRCQHTDHDGITLVFNIDDFRRGPGVWKFNNNHLKDQSFNEKMRKVIVQVGNDASRLGIDDKWEFMKGEATTYAKSYSKEKATSQKINLQNLSKTLEILKRDAMLDPFLEDIRAAITSIENEMTAHEQRKIDGTVFRSRVRFANEGNKCTKYFINLEKRTIIARILEQSKIKKEKLLKNKIKSCESKGASMKNFTRKIKALALGWKGKIRDGS